MPDVAFDPEKLAILVRVFDEACATLQPWQKDNMTRTAVAKIVLTLASGGELDHTRLLDGVLGQYRRTYKKGDEDAERDRIEMALDEGLRETFPASDAVALVQPAGSTRH